ncbi:MAG: TraR/DksA C4-type zinc finger protein [Candidatus Phlomobacter fragariae]
MTSFHCEDCGKPIPEARRIASPGCMRCVDCQSLWEISKNILKGKKVNPWYNETHSYAVQWLRNLIKAGLIIAPGNVAKVAKAFIDSCQWK